MPDPTDPTPFAYSPGRRKPPKPRSSKKLVGIVLGAGLHLAAGGILLWVLFGRGKSTPQPETHVEPVVARDRGPSPPRFTPSTERAATPTPAPKPSPTNDLPVTLPPAGFVSLNTSPPSPAPPKQFTGGPLAAKLTPLVRDFENKHAGPVRALALLPDGQHLLSAGADKLIHTWDTTTAREVKVFAGTPHVVRALAVDCRGIAAASAGDDGPIHLWDVAANREAFALPGHKGAVRGVAFSPNGQYVLSGGDDGSVRVWDISTRESVRDIKLGQPVTCVAFHPDGRRAVVGGDHATVFVIDLEAAATLHKLGGHLGPVTGVAVSRDGRQAVSVSDDRTLRFWDVATGKKVTFAGPTGNGSFSYLRSAQPLKVVAYAGDGSWVIAAGADSSVTIMTVDGRGQATIHPPGKSGLLALVVAPDGGAVYLGTDHADVRRMDFQGGADFIPTNNKTTPADAPPEPTSAKPTGLAPKWTAEVSTGTLQSVAVAAGGRVVTGGSDRTVRVWEPDGKEAHAFPNMTAAEQNVAISRDGATLLVGGSGQERVGRITAGDDCQLRAIALKDNRVGGVGVHASAIKALALSANGRLALTGSETVVRYWDVVGGREIRQYFGHAGPVRAIDFHPKLAQAVSVAADNSVRVWDLNGTKLIRTIMGLPGSPTGVAFSPDGKAILIYGPGVLGTWDAVTGQPLRSFTAAGVPVAATWAPNGHVVTAVDGVVALRSADDGKELLHLASPPAAVTALGVSGDGRLIVAAGRGLAAWEPDKPLVGLSPSAVPTGR